MQVFKGLLNQNILAEQSQNMITKKIQEYKKVTVSTVYYYQMMNKIVQKNVQCYKNAYQQIYQLNNPRFSEHYEILLSLFKSLEQQQCKFSRNINLSYESMHTLFRNRLSELNYRKQTFKQLLKNYEVSYQIIIQFYKRYQKDVSNFKNQMEIYKQTFINVSLVYNNQQKNKRYEICQAHYEQLCLNYKKLEDYCNKLTTLKVNVCEYYPNIGGYLTQIEFILGKKFIQTTKQYLMHCCNKTQAILNVYLSCQLKLKEPPSKKLMNFFKTNVDSNFFTCEIDLLESQGVPPILFYHKNVKEEYILVYQEYIGELWKDITNFVEEQRLFNKKLEEMLLNHIKHLEKNLSNDMKQTSVYYQKWRKKIIQTYGPKLCNFIKYIDDVTELEIMVNKKIYKKATNATNELSQSINEYLKLLDSFEKQLKSNIQKITRKKELRMNFKNEEEQIDDAIYNPSNKEKHKKSLGIISEYILQLFIKYKEKLNSHNSKIYNAYASVINNICKCYSELKQILFEFNQIHFNEQELARQIKIYNDQYKGILQKQNQFFQNLPYGSLANDKTKITVNNYKIEIQSFTKLKKPSGDAHKKQMLTNSSQGEFPTVINDPPPISNLTQISSDKKINRDQQFLYTKIQLKEGQIFVQSFNCSLADKIILSGKLYLTNMRLCFNSKFNSNNLFFGGTFIDIPKTDIKKISKRKHALFFDNSILITTLNGQLFFTTFMNRDKTFKIIQDTFQIRMQQLFLQFLNLDEEDPIFTESKLELEDDITQAQANKRQQVFKAMYLQNNQYVQLVKAHFDKANSYKLFKLFYSGQQFSYNKKSYSSFQYYFKQLNDHTEIDISPWQPNIFQYLNPTNIKKDTPDKFTRITKSRVPLKNMGVPFMPKTVISQQRQKLYLISKEKWIYESQCYTAGAPYADSAIIKTRIVVENNNQQSCIFTFGIFAFFQKQTILKSAIQKRAYEDTKQFTQKRVEQMKKYLIYSSPKKSKAIKQINNQININPEVQNQLKQLKEQNTKLKQALQEQQKKNKIFLSIIFLLTILYVMLCGMAMYNDR